jgi:hypothetical protein
MTLAWDKLTIKLASIERGLSHVQFLPIFPLKNSAKTGTSYHFYTVGICTVPGIGKVNWMAVPENESDSGSETGRSMIWKKRLLLNSSVSGKRVYCNHCWFVEKTSLELNCARSHNRWLMGRVRCSFLTVPGVFPLFLMCLGHFCSVLLCCFSDLKLFTELSEVY